MSDVRIDADGSDVDSLTVVGQSVRRGIVDSDTKAFKAFDEYEENYEDDDLASVSAKQNLVENDEVKLLMYAVSFGRQQDSLSPAYSKAICLLSIVISLRG